MFFYNQIELMEDKNYQTEGGIFAFPKLKPTKFLLNFDPPQLGMLYKRNPDDKKNHLFLVQLNKLILLGDAEAITQALFEKYPAFINEKVTNVEQIYNLVNKLLEYIQNLISQFQEDEADGEVDESDIHTHQQKIKN